MELIAAANHGLVSLTGWGTGIVESDAIADGHLAPRDRLNESLRLTSFASVAVFCQHSDLVFRLPKPFAEEIARGRNLVVREAVPPTGAEFIHVYLYWYDRCHKDAMCHWVCEQLKPVHAAETG